MRQRRCRSLRSRGVVWVATRDLSSYQSRLTEQIRKVTGRELAARVPLTIKLGSEPAMVAEGDTLTTHLGDRAPDLARVCASMTLFLDPFSLFLGEVKIGRIVLEGADILVERNEVGDANLEMLPPPDGSGPHPGENRSLRLRTSQPPSLDQYDRGDGLGPHRLRRAGPSAGGASKWRSAPPSSRRRPTRHCRSTASFSVAAGRAGGPHRHGRLVRRLDAVGCPATSMLQGGFGGGKIAIKGSVNAKGTTLADHGGGPRRLGVRPLCSPAGAGRRSVCAERQGRHLAQQLQGRADDAEGRLERARRRGAVPRRSQGHADHHRQRRRQPPRSR